MQVTETNRKDWNQWIRVSSGDAKKSTDELKSIEMIFSKHLQTEQHPLRRVQFKRWILLGDKPVDRLYSFGKPVFGKNELHKLSVTSTYTLDSEAIIGAEIKSLAVPVGHTLMFKTNETWWELRPVFRSIVRDILEVRTIVGEERRTKVSFTEEYRRSIISAEHYFETYAKASLIYKEQDLSSMNANMLAERIGAVVAGTAESLVKKMQEAGLV